MKIAIITLIAAGLAPANAAEIDFDRGADVKAAIESSSERSAELPAADKYLGHSRYTRDCARFSFGPAAGEHLSERVRLSSTEFVEYCYNTGPAGGHYVPGPNGTPGHYVPAGPSGHHCVERPGQTWYESARVLVKARDLKPWEREAVEVCLEGPFMDLRVLEGGYKYSVRKTGNYDTLFELTPGKRTPMSPDKEGLYEADFRHENGKYHFTVSDKWGGEYAGEKVAIKVELFRDNPNWFDSNKGGKEFVFDAARGYSMEFSEAELDRSKASGQDEEFRGAKKYYLKWGFKRLGSISKDTFVKKGQTGRVEVK
ncbi:MAG: hypothetical protein FD189_2481 [Elusimicrobia bacterium]|nr:MAG: hypothetical protein FD154_2435 [Elusimicrobiota bacterium]KAF0152375.1 MAG: hypothetical protein FD189_2481 [Elusimicrobiota bacterium]